MLLAYFLLHPSLDYCNLSLCLVCLRVVRLDLPLLGNDKIGFWCLFPYLYRKVEYVLLTSTGSAFGLSKVFTNRATKPPSIDRSGKCGPEEELEEPPVSCASSISMS